MSFFKWYDRHPKNRFWCAIGAIAFLLIATVLSWTAPKPIAWAAILVNAGFAVIHMHEWMKLQRGSKS
jgi:hypothetical protein